MRRRSLWSVVVMIAVLAVGFPMHKTYAASCAPAGSATYDDNNLSYMTYSGVWGLLKSPDNGSAYLNAIGQTIHTTTDTSAVASFCFTGSTITLFYSMASNRGNESVYIDGSLRSSFSAYAGQTRRQIGRTWELGAGTHTIEVHANGGGQTDVDAFAVDIATYGYNTYDNPDSPIRYIGSSWVNGSLSGAGRGTISSSNVVGELARLTFRGEKLVLAYDKSPGRSLGVITIDGVDKGTIDYYDSTDNKQYSTVYGSLGPGIHIVTITNAASGQYIDVDYVTVMPNFYAQVFPFNKIANSFVGATAYITTPDPPLYQGKIVELVTVTNYGSGTGLRFIEAGAVKDCDIGFPCPLHPYMSY